MIEQRNHIGETHRILIYTDLAQGTEMTQIYTISSKDTVKDVIKQILARNHLSLKDPNLFYLTFRRQSSHENKKCINSQRRMFQSNVYEENLQLSTAWPLQINQKEVDVTLYSDAILSRTLDLTKDNRLTLHMQTGGVLKVYDSCFSNPASIRQFHIAKTTCSEELIDLILTVAGSSDPVNDYCLVEEGTNEESRILRPKDYPLLIIQSTQSSGMLVLRKREEALTMGKRRSSWISKTKPYFRRSAFDRSSRTPSPVKLSLTQRLNPFPCIFKGNSRSRTTESFNSEPLPSFEKSQFIESEKKTSQPNGNGYFPKPSNTQTKMSSLMGQNNKGDNQDSFTVFDSPTGQNSSNDSGITTHSSTINKTFPTNHQAVNTDPNASEWSLGPSESFLMNHSGKCTSTTPPLPPKSAHHRARCCNGLKDQYLNASSHDFCNHHLVEPPRPHSRNLSSSEKDKKCRSEKSASPILALDANGICENRQNAVRFQENVNGLYQCANGNDCPSEDSTISDFKPKDHLERAESSDSVKTTVPVDWDSKTTIHQQISDGAVPDAAYDNNYRNLNTEYDVPADNSIDRRDSSPSSLLLDIYEKLKCFNKSRSRCSSPQKPPLALNRTQVANIQQYQERMVQTDESSRNTSREPLINSPSRSYHEMNGDYDASFNDLFHVKTPTNEMNSHASPCRMYSPASLTLSAHINNDSSKSWRVIENKSFETFTSNHSDEVFSPDKKHQIVSNGVHTLQNGNHNTQSSLMIASQLNDSDVNVSSVSRENMLTLAAEIPTQLNISQQYGMQLNLSPNHFIPNNILPFPSQQHSPTLVQKLFTYNFEAMRNSTSRLSSSDVSAMGDEKIISLKENALTNTKPANSSSKKTNHKGANILVHGCTKTRATTFNTDYSESYPSLFDVLHHCDIYRVLLDPNLPSLSDQLGLRLCLTKFPLDDVQRADTLQKLQYSDKYGKKDSNESINSVHSSNRLNGSKPRVRSPNSGTFPTVDIQQAELSFDVVTIESIEPDSPASFEGSLAPGHIILEVDGKDLLRPHYLKDVHGNRMNVLDVARNQLRNARQAALTAEIPPIRITAAQYHSNFGSANAANNLERFNSSIRSKNEANKRKYSLLNHQTMNSISYEKQNLTNGDLPVRESHDENTNQTHESNQSLRKTSEEIDDINSKSVSELTDFSEDGVNSLKSKLIWFPHRRDEYPSQSPFDPRSHEFFVNL
ncbi:unnamed protein product [Trichobilharzia szidati]|nr:unnamed protein product [Trichobilharzia szidati]